MSVTLDCAHVNDLQEGHRECISMTVQVNIFSDQRRNSVWTFSEHSLCTVSTVPGDLHEAGGEGSE